MGIRYALVLNVSRDVSDSCDVRQVADKTREYLSHAGFAIEGASVTKGTVDSFLPPRRGVVGVGVGIPGRDILTPQETMAVDTAVVTAIRDTARRQWSVLQTIEGLPRQGDGNYRPSWFGDVTDISRQVARGSGVPTVTVTHPTSQTTIQQSTDPTLPPGTQRPSGLVDAGKRAKDGLGYWIGENKPLLIGGVVVVGIVATAIIVVKVKD